MPSTTPECTHPGLGSSDFARRYFRNRSFFLFLRLLRCFSSAGSLRMTIYSSYGTWSLSMWVSPFGYLRVNGYLLLTAAFRSLSRPSSAPSARASTLRSFCLTALTLPLAYGRQALLGSLFPLLTVSCQFDVFLSNASSFDESFLIRYSVFMVPRLSLPYRPREICTPLSSSAFETLSILKRSLPGSHLLSHGLTP